MPAVCLAFHSMCQSKNGNRAYLQGQTQSLSLENVGQTNNIKVTSEAVSPQRKVKLLLEIGEKSAKSIARVALSENSSDRGG